MSENNNLKLIIQIPCFNEEFSLPITLAELPRQIDGFSTVEWLIIDDGSTDNTIQVAKENNVDHIIVLPKHLGLAKAFMLGLDACLKLGADVIINTDADNQYCANDIQKLVQPILNGKADMVIGERPISTTEYFSTNKKILQKVGSWFVRKLSNTDVPDAPSGFRAINREAAYRLNIFNTHTYTLDTIIQAGQKDIRIESVPVRTNPKLRESKLIKSTWRYVLNSILLIIKLYITYQPFKFFILLSVFFFTICAILGIRFTYYFMAGIGNNYIKSLIVSGFFLFLGSQTIILAFLSDNIGTNRKLSEDILYRVRKIENNESNRKSR